MLYQYTLKLALDRVYSLYIPWSPPDIKPMLVRTHKWYLC